MPNSRILICYTNNYTVMRYVYTIFIILLSLFSSCDFILDKTPSLDEAEDKFISEAQIISEKEAISEEISWYRAPQITERTLSRKLNGKDVIHEMNLLLKENEDAKPGIYGMTFTWNVKWINKAKDYAVEHPDEIIAAEYYFTGIFTNCNEKSKFSTIRRRLLYIYKPVDYWWNFYVYMD